MGKRGPARTPTKILETRGSWLADRRQEDVQPERGRPTRPRWVAGDARKAWETLVPQIERMGILGKIDGNALARYCIAWARWRKMETFIDENGEVYPTKDANGVVTGFRMFPQVRIADALSTQLNRLEAKFGLSPADRSGLRAILEQPTIVKQKDTGDKVVSDKSRFFTAG